VKNARRTTGDEDSPSQLYVSACRIYDHPHDNQVVGLFEDEATVAVGGQLSVHFRGLARLTASRIHAASLAPQKITARAHQHARDAVVRKAADLLTPLRKSKGPADCAAGPR
jgi:hypothetical protein